MLLREPAKVLGNSKPEGFRLSEILTARTPKFLAGCPPSRVPKPVLYSFLKDMMSVIVNPFSVCEPVFRVSGQGGFGEHGSLA